VFYLPSDEVFFSGLGPALAPTLLEQVMYRPSWFANAQVSAVVMEF
jgi:hypothetical protein